MLRWRPKKERTPSHFNEPPSGEEDPMLRADQLAELEVQVVRVGVAT